MVYLMTFVSIFIGGAFGLDLVRDSILHRVVYVGVAKEYWGWALLLAASTLLIGLFCKNISLVSFGSGLGFVLWLYTVILLLLQDHLYVAITVGVLHSSFMAYVFLANSLGYLHRRPA